VPGRPAMDIALVMEQIGDVKELVQSLIEASHVHPGEGPSRLPDPQRR
jgi:hypothetical protein